MVFIPLKIPKCYFLQKYAVLKFHIYKGCLLYKMSYNDTNNYNFQSFHSFPTRQKKSGTDLGTEYGGTVCGFHTRP